MKIVVTGGAGYVGSILVPYLLAQRHHVTVVDRLLYEQSSLNACFGSLCFTFIKADVRNYPAYSEALRTADYFIPLACLVGAPVCEANEYDAVAVNYDAIRVAVWSYLNKDARILFPTTNSGYGASAVPCNEDTPLRPLSTYARTKVDAEAYILKRGNAITFRLATAFGASPRMRIDLLVNDFVYRAVKDRSLVLFEPYFRRNFIHVADIARVFLHAINNFKPMQDRTYNVGLSDANLSKADLCRKIVEYLPDFKWKVDDCGVDPDKRDYVVDNSRIERTGWKPQFSLDDGIVELIKLYGAISNARYGNV